MLIKIEISNGYCKLRGTGEQKKVHLPLFSVNLFSRVGFSHCNSQGYIFILVMQNLRNLNPLVISANAYDSDPQLLPYNLEITCAVTDELVDALGSQLISRLVI